MPNTGPKDGSRRQVIVLCPSWFNACARPMVVSVLPSPAGVGVIAVTNTSLPSLFFDSLLIASKEILALYLPYNSKSSSVSPTFFAMSTIDSSFVCCAISMSLNTFAMGSAPVLESVEKIAGHPDYLPRRSAHYDHAPCG